MNFAKVLRELLLNSEDVLAWILAIAASVCYMAVAVLASVATVTLL